jgi:ABC-type branched-subunit amino acid transport system substrate-binding protein
MKTRMAMAGLTVGACLIAAGCGSSSDSGTTSAPAGTSTAAAAPASDSLTGKEVKIGFIGPLTGPIASTGSASLDGVKAAIAYLEQSADGTAGGVTYKLLTRDTAGNATQSAAAARELIDQGVVAIIGDISGGTTAAIQPFVTRSKVLSINSNTFGYAEKMGTEFKYSYSDGELPVAFTEPPAKYFADRGAKTIGVIYSADPYGETEWAAYQKLASADLKIVGQSYPSTATDVTSQLSKLKDAGAEAISSYTYSPLPVLLGLGKLGWSPPVSAPLAVVNPAVIDSAKKAAPKVVENVISAPLPDKMLSKDGQQPTDPVVLGWQEQMKKLIGRELNGNDTISAYGFDWVMILDGAIRNAGSIDPDQLVAALDSGKPVPGVRDDYRFGPQPEQRQGVPADRQSAFYPDKGCPNGICVQVPGS